MIIGLGGIPDAVRTWGEWLKALGGTIDAWQDHGLFRVLLWTISVIALTNPQWLPSLRRRFFAARPRVGDSDSEFQHVAVTNRESSIHSEPQYTARTPDEILGVLEGLTSIEAEQLGGMHVGLRIQASGVIEDVESDHRDDTTKAKVRFHTTHGSGISARFADGFEATARTLNGGMSIKVDGEIEHVRAGEISLRDSHLEIESLPTSSSIGVGVGRGVERRTPE